MEIQTFRKDLHEAICSLLYLKGVFFTLLISVISKTNKPIRSDVDWNTAQNNYLWDQLIIMLSLVVTLCPLVVVINPLTLENCEIVYTYRCQNINNKNKPIMTGL